MKYTFLLISILVFQEVVACTIPQLGVGWNKDQLIQNSKSIILAKVKSIEKVGRGAKYTLSPVEVLRGKSGDINFRSQYEPHYGNDYNFHRDAEFWIDGIGRSEFPCCICGPSHTFKKGESYLLFPDAFGAMKSAEIIKTKDDEWYRYVIERVGK